MAHDPVVTRGIRYGAARVGISTQPRERDLHLDAYRPAGAPGTPPTTIPTG